ncbi:MAG TPA: hypothetical protein VKB11_05530, partial [Acidimicrobiia bacterium]|nr:hypothetical protein [Acidimicrobiia bacterium]
MRRRIALLVAAALVLAACGYSSSGGSVSSRPPVGTDEVVVRVVTSGGFAAESRQPAQLPQLSVFGDGRLIVYGPTTLQFPGPALPNLQEVRVTGAGLRRIVDEARAAGLLDDPPPDYGEPGVTDQATTTVTVRAGSTTRQVEVYALGFKGRVSGVTPEHSENRRRLQQFIQLAGDPGALDEEVVRDSERRYEPAALAVLVRPSDSTEGDTRAWPLGDLAATDCTVYTDGDLGTVLDAAR